MEFRWMQKETITEIYDFRGKEVSIDIPGARILEYRENEEAPWKQAQDIPVVIE